MFDSCVQVQKEETFVVCAPGFNANAKANANANVSIWDRNQQTSLNFHMFALGLWVCQDQD